MIIVNLDVMLAKRKMRVSDLADKVGITLANISILKNEIIESLLKKKLIMYLINMQPNS